MARGRKSSKSSDGSQPVKSYKHPDAESVLRPDVGTQAQFKKKKPPVTYRYDSSLSPEMNWDGENPARELGEWLISCIEEASKIPEPHLFPKIREFVGGHGKVMATVRGLQDAIDQLKRISKPFLNWAGKAERLSFDVPTLPLFVHERLSTKAILETLKGHKRDKQLSMFDLFGDREHPIHDQVLRAYEHKNGWSNRLILGDSLVVMNSLLHYEGMAGQVQMIFMDPPYGIKFGSNFQPFVRKRDVKHNDDEDLIREPEMVKAYRDTWELGLHSYLTYLRDRLLLDRELLHPSGSIFVQISDENLHHVRELMDEVFGRENFAGIITFQKTGGMEGDLLPPTVDYLLWYGRDHNRIKYRQLYSNRKVGDTSLDRYDMLMLNNGSTRRLSKEELEIGVTPAKCKRYQLAPLYSEGAASDGKEFLFEGKIYTPRSDTHWKTTIEGLNALANANRIEVMGSVIRYRRFVDDFPVIPITDRWESTQTGTQRIYVVQTSLEVIKRCLLMTTDPGDLILDTTCGSGSSAYVAEQWGRRWITVDISRVPLALARQRLLTATYPYYELKDENRGPSGGFVYKRKQNTKGEEMGGIVPHVTLKSIANNEPPEEEVLVDRPEVDKKITRVTGPFSVEATIPTPVDWEEDNKEAGALHLAEEQTPYLDRMIEILRKSPVLHVGGGKTVILKNVRLPAKTLSLSAEAVVDASAPGQRPTLTDVVQEANEKNFNLLPFSQKSVAIVFGPDNGAISEKLVFEAAREAYAKSYTHLYVIGFAIQPNARQLIEKCEEAVGVPATYVQATPDLLMGDLLKNMRSSQIFSCCGLPEIKIHKNRSKKGEPNTYQVELLGLDVFDPVTMEVDHPKGDDVPAWFLDTDYNGLCFHVSQAFFPRTSAWENLKRSLKNEYEDSIWEHLSGTISTPFEAGEKGQVAVKVIDDRGNELLVVKSLKEGDHE